VEVGRPDIDFVYQQIEGQNRHLNPFTHSRAAAMVASGALELDALVTKTIGLEEVADVVGKAPLPGEIKVIVRP
ncbi:iditol 2-dehydrogenase, partial [Rhizobium ruizarguesonis]